MTTFNKYFHLDSLGYHHGGVSEADPHPRRPSPVLEVDPENESDWMPPPFGATNQEPPAPVVGKIRRFLDGAWTYETDLVGLRYWFADRRSALIQNYGEELPAGALPEDPGPTAQEIWNDLRSQASQALANSNNEVLLCYENGDPVPDALKNRRTELRRIIASSTPLDGVTSIPTP